MSTRLVTNGSQLVYIWLVISNFEQRWLSDVRRWREPPGYRVKRGQVVKADAKVLLEKSKKLRELRSVSYEWAKPANDMRDKQWNNRTAISWERV